MPEWVKDVAEFLGPYWPFIVKVVFFWYVGQHMKKRVWTRERATRGGFWLFARQSMWTHPTVAGVVLGLMYPALPAVEMVGTRGGAVLEGVLAGIVSTTGFMALERAAEQFGWTWVLRTLRDTGRPTSVPPPPEKSA